MKNLIVKLIGRLGANLNAEAIRNNQKMIIFIICLIIATILWFLNALSKNYITSISYPVKYVNLPENKFIINEPPRQLELKVNAHGFTLLRYKMKLALTPVVLNISEILTEYRSAGNATYSIPSSSFNDMITNQVSSEIRIMDIRPVHITLVLDSLESRMIPVKPKAEIHFRPRFDFSDSTVVSPERVRVSGPRALMGSIDTIFTVAKVFRNVDETIHQDIALEIPPQTIVDPKKVKLYTLVDEYTENSFNVPIQIRSLPEGEKLRLFPQEAMVSFRIGLKHFATTTPDAFEIFVDYQDMLTGTATLPLKYEEIPTGVKNLKISPSHVEYLIEKY